MDDLTIARALHVVAILHWLGGVSFVTLVILPALIRSVPRERRVDVFEMIEGRFAFQARISTLLAGATGLFMIHRLDAWDRFADITFWWMHAMVALWALFTVVLFIAEPLFLHRLFQEHAARDPEKAFGIVLTLHRLLLVAAVITTLGAVLGVHGALML